MKKKKQTSFGALVGTMLTTGIVGAVLIASGTTAAAVPLISAAFQDNGRTDLANIDVIEQRSLSVDGFQGSVKELSAFRDGEMIDLFGDIEGTVFRPGQAYWVAASQNASDQHYIAAVELDSGIIMVRSDSSASVVCGQTSELTADASMAACLRLVTNDSELQSATPQWTEF